MVAYSFQRRFVTPILAGRKRQTVRQVGKRRHATDGETIQIYTGMRTKSCRLLGLAVCASVMPIAFDSAEQRITIRDTIYEMRADLETFAESDGFASVEEMFAFFAANGNPPQWSGVLITWRDFVENMTKGIVHVDD